jgi:hypothetical protein
MPCRGVQETVRIESSDLMECSKTIKNTTTQTTVAAIGQTVRPTKIYVAAAKTRDFAADLERSPPPEKPGGVSRCLEIKVPSPTIRAH